MIEYKLALVFGTTSRTIIVQSDSAANALSLGKVLFPDACSINHLA